MGIAAVDAAVTAIINIVRVIEAGIFVGIHPFGRSLLKPITATAVALGVTSSFVWFVGSGWIAAIAGLALGGVAYVAVLNRVELDPEERQVWEGVVRKMRHLKPSLVGNPHE